MYGIDIFDRVKMQLDWSIVYYGIKNNILSHDIAQEYACRILEHNELPFEEEVELSWNSGNRLDVLELVEKILAIQGNRNESMEKAKDKIRIAIIIYLRNTERDINKLLEKINIVYADFGYPVDMEKFISYMPMDDEYVPSEHTFEENNYFLLSRLDLFIEAQVEKYQLKNTI